MNRVVYIVLLICLCFTSVSVFGNDNLESDDDGGISIESIAILRFYSDLSISSSGSAYVVSTLTADATKVNRIEMNIRLLKLNNGLWEHVSSWRTDNFCSEDYFEGVVSVEVGYQYKIVSRGYTYMNNMLVESSYTEKLVNLNYS